MILKKSWLKRSIDIGLGISRTYQQFWIEVNVTVNRVGTCIRNWNVFLFDNLKFFIRYVNVVRPTKFSVSSRIFTGL